MFAAELLKLRTVAATKITIAVGAAGLLLTQVLLITLLPALANGALGADVAPSELGPTDPGTAAFQSGALDILGGGSGMGSVGAATIAVVLLGLFAATTDYRYGGIVATALAQPRRTRILVGKAAATAVTAAAFALLLAVICVAVLLISVTVLPSTGLVLGWTDILATLGRGAIVVVLLALLGLAIGVLVRSQLAGVLVVVALLLLEPIVQAFAQLFSGALPLWAQLLPLSLGRTAIAGGDGGAVLPWGVALAALAGIVLAALAAGAAVLRRRDL